MNMRIVTRPDFDGIVCAVLLYDAEKIDESIKWVEPSALQKGLVDIREGDIIANLPYDGRCSMWFDHHVSNRIEGPFRGGFKIAPSAAGIVFDHYKDFFSRDYGELVKETDKIDSADLTQEEVLNPENYPHVLLSMTVSGRDERDQPYWNYLVDLLGKLDVATLLDDPQVKQRCEGVVEQNRYYKTVLEDFTVLDGHVAVTDFRVFDKSPMGNRFLSYSLFPDSSVNVKIRYDDANREKVIVSVGHSIFNDTCNVNVGLMLSAFEGGGHKGAGACSFHVSKSENYIPQILDILLKNENNDS
jgi:hypothetical protein